MPVFRSAIDPGSDTFKRNRAEMLELVDEVRALEQQARDKSSAAAERFAKRGQLLPRERLTTLLDPGAPVLEIGNVSGYEPTTGTGVPGGGLLAVIGYISGTRCVVVANDSAIDAGAMTPAGGHKMGRAAIIALENHLPYVMLVESAGADLMGYRVEQWHQGGRLFALEAKLSAAGIPVVAVQHGSGTAGGAYFPGLADVVIGVRGRGYAFLAGPPLLKAATGEIAEAEELGGIDMHSTVSGLVEHVAEDDRDALRICRDVVKNLHWARNRPSTGGAFDEPVYDPDELAGVVPVDVKKPYDCREVIARVVDGSEILEFKADYGPMTVCAQASVHGHPAGIIANNGAIDNAGANKVTHFIARCTQLGLPLVFLQNITGYMVGVESERGGMIKNGSKMIQAVTTTTSPKLTLLIGGSYGAGNYGMCGMAYEPRLIMAWPNARQGVMGGAQAAGTMRVVAEQKMARAGIEVDPAQLDSFADTVVELFESQSSALVSSGRLCDDGILDPRDTRAMLGFSLGMTAEAAVTQTNPLSFGVGRI